MDDSFGLSGKDVSFLNPVTMSGRELGESELSGFKKEFEDIRKICEQAGETNFK